MMLQLGSRPATSLQRRLFQTTNLESCIPATAHSPRISAPAPRRVSLLDACQSLIVHGSAWMQGGTVPPKYLAMLEELLPDSLVVTLSIPTFREQRHEDVCSKVTAKTCPALLSIPHPSELS